MSQAKYRQGTSASSDSRRDMIPRTGMGAGGVFVESASKFLQSYGKILAPVVVIVLVGIFVYYFTTSIQGESSDKLRKQIDAAAHESKQETLKDKFETAIAEVDKGGDEALLSYAYYRWAVRSSELLAKPYKPEELEKALKQCDVYLEKYAEKEGLAGQAAHVKAIKARLADDLKYLKENSSTLPWTKDSKGDKPSAKTVKAPENPIIVFVTSVGNLRFELFEDGAANAVKNMVSLIDEGFFDRTDFDTLEFSNKYSPSPDYRFATLIKAGEQGRPKGVKLDKPTGQEKDEKADTAPKKNPYTIDYQGDTSREFVPGTIAFMRDPEDGTRARTEFFVVVEPSWSLRNRFAPLGQLVGTGDALKAQLEIVSRLQNAKIYFTYVEQKREGTDYKPSVYYDGWPLPTTKRDEPPKPLRFGELTLEVADKENPLVVIELESGDVLIELFQDVSMNTVLNFISLVEEKAYNKDCSFYRVEGTGKGIVDIMKAGQGLRIVQGGKGGSTSHDYTIKNEAVENPKYDAAGIKNKRGTIAMARTNDLHSAATEFFVNLKDFPDWDKKASPYCVFGRVLEGLELLEDVKANDKIKSIKMIRKRSGENLPQVKYKDKGDYEKKKKVDPPKDEPKKEEEKK
jgi:cyclophilin family peptidyl-prolyl cis-trans isomerase